MSLIAEVSDIDEPDKDTDNHDNLRQNVAEIVQLLLQRRRLRDLRRDAGMNIPNSRRIPRQSHHSPGMSNGHGSSREQHIDLVLFYRLVIPNWTCVFSNAFTFTGKDGLVDAEAVALDRQDSAIGRDTIPDGDVNDIAWNKLFGTDPGDVTVTDDLSFVRGVLVECGDCLLGAAFL